MKRFVCLFIRKFHFEKFDGCKNPWGETFDINIFAQACQFDAMSQAIHQYMLVSEIYTWRRTKTIAAASASMIILTGPAKVSNWQDFLEQQTSILIMIELAFIRCKASLETRSESELNRLEKLSNQ